MTDHFDWGGVRSSPFEEARFPTVETWHVVMIWACASLVSCLLFLCCYSALPAVRQTPGWQLLRSTVCELVESCLWLMIACADAQYARLLWLPLLACDIAANGLRLTMYVDLLIVYRNPFSPRRFRPAYYLLVAWAALGGAASAALAGRPVSQHVLVWDLVYLPCLALWLVGGVLYALMRVLLLQRHNSAFAHVSDMARLRAVRHCGAYLAVYGLLLGALVLAYQLDARQCASGGEGADGVAPAAARALGLSCNSLWHLLAALTAGRPAIAFGGWLLINDVPRALCARARAHLPTSASSLGLHPLSPSRAGHARAAGRAPAAGGRVPAKLAGARSGGVAGGSGGSAPATAGLREPLLGVAGARAQYWPPLDEEAGAAGAAVASPGVAMTSPRLAGTAAGTAPGALSQSAKPTAQRGAARAGDGELEHQPSSLGAARAGGCAEIQSCAHAHASTAAATARTDAAADETNASPPGIVQQLRYELVYEAMVGIGEAARLALERPLGAVTPHATPLARHSDPAAAVMAGVAEEAPRAVDGLTGVRAAGTHVAHGLRDWLGRLRGAAAASAVPPAAHATPAPLCPPTQPATPLPPMVAPRSSLPPLAPLPPPLLPPRAAAAAAAAAAELRTETRGRVRHYARADFEAVRLACRIDATEYARVFPTSPEAMLGPDWARRLAESVSEGASGSFFYRVRHADGCESGFLVKQISAAEKRALLRALPAYREHVERRAGRTLLHYYGCHSVRLRWLASVRIYFVVMRNFAPVRAHLVFDLKGATANRRALASSSLFRFDSPADAADAPPRDDPMAAPLLGGARPRRPGASAYGTLRDWEWMDVAMAFELAAEDALALRQALAADSAFLASQRLIDYSLLVAVARVADVGGGAGGLQLDMAAKARSLRRLQAAGGIVSRDRQKVYFVGVIDALTQHSLGWALQAQALRALYTLACRPAAADGITALPPALYADRFMAFAISEVLGGADALGAVGREGGAIGARQLESIERWKHLWVRRRHGLLRERIESERADLTMRIAELEQVIERLGTRRQLAEHHGGGTGGLATAV